MTNIQGKLKNQLLKTLAAFVAVTAMVLGALIGSPAAFAADGSRLGTAGEPRAGASVTLPADCKILPGGFDKLKIHPELAGRDQEILAKVCKPNRPGFYSIDHAGRIIDEHGNEVYEIGYSVKFINDPGVDVYAQGAIRLPVGDAPTPAPLPTQGGEVTPTPAPDPSTTAPQQPSNPSVQRVAGKDRVATAIAAYRAGNFQGDTVVLVSGKTYPDALAAAPLAAQRKAPILVTTSPQLEPSILQVLQEKRVARVVIVGGERSVPAAVANRLQGEGFKVERVAGNNRSATAVEVAKAVGALRPNQKLFVVDGTNFADALAVGAVANKHGGAILLSNGKQLPPETLNYLKATKVGVVAVGGNAAASLKGYGEITTVVGVNRHQTAVKVAEQFAPEAKYAAVVSAIEFADALGAGALAADNGGVLLLSPKSALDKDTATYLRGSQIEQVSVIGGPNTVNEAVLQAIK
ncbi:cell wall-binding repeat-containing protein [Buchananella felis]|uniref:cell wall-binding repeat-containing protein n=1 Tax=Buchananella felis TaxID=3231492 RepID=UPI003527CF65